MCRRTATFILLAGLIVPGLAQTKRHGHAAVNAHDATKNSVAVERTIQEIEIKWLDALVRRDQAAVADILAPEFHDTTMTGEVRDRQQALAAMLNPIRPDLQRSIGRLEVQSYEGNFAVARGIMLVSGKGIPQARVAFTDVFVRRDGKWQAVAAQENLQQRQ